MNDQNNVCIRCGKQRILVKSWEEKVDTYQGQSTLTFKQFGCPDAECQKAVDMGLTAQREASAERQKAMEARAVKRQESIARGVKQRKKDADS